MNEEGENYVENASKLVKKGEISTMKFRLEMGLDADKGILSIQMENFIAGYIYFKMVKGLDQRMIKNFVEIFQDICEKMKGREPMEYDFGDYLPSRSSKNFICVGSEGRVKLQGMLVKGQNAEQINKEFILDFSGNIDKRKMQQAKMKRLKYKNKNLQKENATLVRRVEQIEKILEQNVENKIKDDAKLVRRMDNFEKMLQNNREEKEKSERQMHQQKEEINKLKKQKQKDKQESENSIAQIWQCWEQASNQMELRLKETIKEVQACKQQLKKYEDEKLQRDKKQLYQLTKINADPIDSQSKEKCNYLLETVEGVITITKVPKNGDDLLLMQPVIDPNRVFIFKFRVKYTAKGAILIGIMDRNRRNTQITVNNPSMAGYNGHSRVKYPGGTKEGSGYKQGDTVQAVIDFKAKSIMYRVNEKLEAILATPKEGTNFVPFIIIQDDEDCVEWLGFQYTSSQ